MNKKFYTSALAACMALGMVVPAFAADVATPSQTDLDGKTWEDPAAGQNVEITKSGEAGTSYVTLIVPTEGTAQFKVTVPTKLPFAIAADGTVSVAKNAKIKNKSNGQVKVSQIVANTTHGWAIVAEGTDFTKIPVNSKQLTMGMNGAVDLNSNEDIAGSQYAYFAPTALNTTSDPLDLVKGGFGIINGKTEQRFHYTGDFAEQGNAIDEASVADVVFTIEWNTAD